MAVDHRGPARPSEMLDRHARRVGVKPEQDVAAQFQMSLLRNFIDLLHSALDDEHMDPDVTRRIIERVIYGGMPNSAEVEYRVGLTERMADALARGSTTPILDPTKLGLGRI